MRVVISLGDVNGIGPEIVLRALRRPAVRRLATFTLIGSRRALAFWEAHTGIAARDRIIDVGDAGALTPGAPTAAGGAAAARAIETGAHLCLHGAADVLVTAPIAKQALAAAGVPFPGHTEFLRHLCRAPRVMMMLLSPRMRVALMTIHEALARVPTLLTRRAVTQRLRDLDASLRCDFALARPRLAVLGLNPHAGECGLFGREESRVIGPAIAAARRHGIRAEGPFPADGFFARWKPRTFDAILAMYHDQGLIPLKMDARGGGVNVTLGLPIVRTSPDHGTAFDIAGTGRADPASFIAAIRVGVAIARNRRRAR